MLNNMKKVNIYKVEYKVDINTPEVNMQNAEQVAFVVGYDRIPEKIMNQWNKDNVRLVPGSINVFPYMQDVYYDEEYIHGHAELFKVTSKDGQKKYFSVLTYTVARVHEYMRENKLSEKFDPFTNPYYISYENCNIIL